MDAEKKRIALQGVLFIVTFITTTIAGAEWGFMHSVYAVTPEGSLTLNSNYTWADFFTGLPYSLSFLFILSVHEFGHYFTARYHQIKTSLPYYIPLPPFPTLIGTLGALIRIRQRIPTTTQNFDVGIAGPLAGFIAAIGVLIFGMVTLPPPEYIFQIHPDYKQYGLNYADHVYTPQFLKNSLDIVVGKNFMMDILASIFADPARMPNRHELMHYPILFAGFLSLFFTALNLLPIGQLDGGHVVFGMFGKKIHRVVASIVFCVILFFAGMKVLTPGQPIESTLLVLPIYAFYLYSTLLSLGFQRLNTIILALVIILGQYLSLLFFSPVQGNPNYLMLLILFLFSRFIGVRHPGAEIEEPLTIGRKILGWLALAILILCFTPSPISLG